MIQAVKEVEVKRRVEREELNEPLVALKRFLDLNFEMIGFRKKSFQFPAFICSKIALHRNLIVTTLRLRLRVEGDEQVT